MRSINTRNLLFAGIYAAILVGTVSTSAWAQQVPQAPPAPPVPAVPAVPDHAQHVIIDSHDHGSHGFLGVVLTLMTPELRAHFGAPKNAGIMVSIVEPKSPAAKAKVKVGDIIIQAGKTKIDCAGMLQKVVRAKKKGETLKLKIVRNKKVKTIAVKVEERKREIIDIGKHIVLPNLNGSDIDIRIDLGELEETLEGLDEFVIPDLEGLIDIEKMEAHIEKALNDPKIKKKLEELKKMEEKEKALEKRMKELEKKMKALNKKLQSKLEKAAAKKTASPA